MQCPKEQLQLTKFNDPLTADGTMYGVTGCGKRGTYVSEGADTWILNTDTGQPTQAPAASN
jgi:hypothetical protein